MHAENNYPSDGRVREYRKTQNGILEVFLTFSCGQLVQEAFSLDSLPNVLGLAMTTVEGRYVRGHLHLKKVDIPTGAGRPKRGFLMEDFEEIMNVILTKRATLTAKSTNHTTTNSQAYPLVAEQFGGKGYYTMDALARHFSLSPTTVRNKLTAAGLMNRRVTLGSNPLGGRPKRGFPESMGAQLKLALVDGESFATDIDRVLAGTNGKVESAKQYMTQNTTFQKPSVGVRSAGLSLVQPAPGSAEVKPGAMALDLAAELDRITGAGAVPYAAPVDQRRSRRAEDYCMTQAQIEEQFERVRLSHLNDNAPTDIDDIVSDLTGINNNAESSQLHHMVMPAWQINAFAQQWDAQWKEARLKREPELEQCRALLIGHLTDGDRPTLEEMFAASRVYSRLRPMLSEIESLREFVASGANMVKAYRAAVRPEVEATEAFRVALRRFELLWEPHQAALDSQRRAADRASASLIESHAEMPSDDAFEQVEATLTEAGVHPIYTKVAMADARWYFTAAATREVV